MYNYTIENRQITTGEKGEAEFVTDQVYDSELIRWYLITIFHQIYPRSVNINSDLNTARALWCQQFLCSSESDSKL